MKKQITVRPTKNVTSFDAIRPITRDGMEVVNARDLHFELHSGAKFSDWFRDRVRQGEFIEDKDYFTVSENYAPEDFNNLRSGKINYFVSVSMAEHLCLMERTEIGKKIRQKYICWRKELFERKKEDDDLDLAVNNLYARQVAKRREAGMTEKEAQRTVAIRILGVGRRNWHTGVLQAHEVTRRGFALCTDATNVGVIGLPAAMIRIERRVPKYGKTRDFMNAEELTAIALSEEMSTKKIIAQDKRGDQQCAEVCLRAGQKVRQAMLEFEAEVI